MRLAGPSGNFVNCGETPKTWQCLLVRQLTGVLLVLGLGVAVNAVQIAAAGYVPDHHRTMVNRLLPGYGIASSGGFTVAQAVARRSGPAQQSAYV